MEADMIASLAGRLSDSLFVARVRRHSSALLREFGYVGYFRAHEFAADARHRRDLRAVALWEAVARDALRQARRASIEARILAPLRPPPAWSEPVAAPVCPLAIRCRSPGPGDRPIPPTDGVHPPMPWPTPAEPFGRGMRAEAAGLVPPQ
jgi:hypothetical protein